LKKNTHTITILENEGLITKASENAINFQCDLLKANVSDLFIPDGLPNGNFKIL